MDTHSDLPQQMKAGGGIGALLRASRLRRGEEPEDIAAALRIRRVYIEAIEEDRFDDLPGHAYAVGFVRGYAEYLDLDGEDVVRRFKEESSVPDQPAELSFPSFIPQHGMPRGAVLMVGVLVAALGYGGWYFLSTQDRFVAEVVTPVPSRLQPEAAQETAPAAAANAASVQPVTDAPETSQSPAADPEVTETALTAAPASSDAPGAAPEPVETPAVVASAPGPVETPAIVASAPETAVEPPAEPAPPEVTEAVEAPPPPTAETDATVSETAPAANSEAVETAPAGATEPRPAPEMAEASTEPAAETAEIGAAAAPEPPAMPDTPAASEPAPEPDPTQVALNDTGQPATEPAETQIAAVQPATADETPASAVTEEEPRIVVRAKIASWVQVRDDTENQSIMTRLLKAGDVYEVPNRPGLVLMTGNAGALEITVDGEVVPSIGDPGTVRRHVALEPDRLKDGTAVVE
ncbi:MAG: DUF4115 domain-containing protein [Rhodospirillales bacterium]|nr:DUF4115 domain-containing protein [Rhodospirillales bacterium]